MPPSLSSASSAMLKQFRQAFRGSAAVEHGERLLPLEGPRLIAEALRAGVKIESVLFSDGGEARFSAKLRPQLSKHTTVAVAGENEFRAAMDVEHPQGVAALARLPVATLEQALAPAARPGGGAPLLLAVAGLQDPGNLGTLLRAADAFGAGGVVALRATVSPFHPKAIRASAGSILHLPVVAEVTPEELLAACRAHGVALLLAATRGKLPLDRADLRSGFCLVVGGETGSLPRPLQRAAQATLAVPMAATVESLNAGIAGAIILYEAQRQRAAGPL